MPFVKDYSMCCVEFINARKFNVLKDGVDEELEVSDGRGSPIDIVGRGDGEEVCNIRANLLEERFGLFFR